MERIFGLTADRLTYYREIKKLEGYHLKFINRLLEKIDLRGKTVLEIGGSNLPNELVIGELGAKQWVCVDKFWDMHTKMWPDHYAQNPNFSFSDKTLNQAMSDSNYVIFNELADNIGEQFFGVFDVCISLCSFEHIKEVLSILNKIHSSLVPGGMFFTQFGPIWSSCGGSHFFVNEDFNFNTRHPLPDHAHLLLTYPQILEIFIAQNYPLSEAEWHAYNVYSGHRCDVNGFFYEDYERLMQMSDFTNYRLAPGSTTWVDDKAMSELQKKYYPYKRFDVWEIEILAKK